MPLLAIVACVHHTPSVAPVVRLDASLDVGVRTESECPALPAVPDAATRFELALTLTRSRVFRDGSVGWLLVFDDVQRDGAPHPLTGRSVELRRFGDGEILDVDLLEHALGGDRQLEVIDLLLPVVSPHPPDLRPGGVAPRTTSWPLRLPDGRTWNGSSDATWTLKETDDAAGVRAWVFAYDGTWTTDGPARGPRARSDRPQTTATGPLQGEVRISVRDGLVVSHTFDWARRLEVLYPRATKGPCHITQHQSFSGSLRRR